MTADSHASAAAKLARPLTHRDILGISLPIIVSNVTTPLVGLVDTAVIGQLGDPALIGGVAIGAALFSLLFWTFGFLRMGTSGMTAQSVGAGNASEVAANLFRALLMALVLGLALVALQAPIGTVSIWLMGGSADVAAAARTYYDWRIWSAPFALANYALLGWLIGLGFAGRAFLVQIVLNSVNIALSMLLVLRLGLGVEGVAVASLIAEAVGTMLGLLLCVGHLRRSATSTRLAQIMDKGELRRAFGLNTNIMVRSLCLLFAFTYFTAQSARMGDVTLAANAILLDLFGLAAYFLDGFSHSAETFTGQAIGARRKDRLMEAFWLSILWASVLAVLASVILLFGGTTMIDIMTTSNPVRTQARGFLIWAALSPLFGYVAFLFDGIYAGATRGGDMRNMMLASLIVFLGSTWVLVPAFGNHGLWAALMVFFAVRGITLGLRFPAVVAQAIAPPTRATH